jgi:signal peptidase complex subunit 1
MMVQVISFIVGFFLQDIKLALFLGLGGTALTFALVVPPWPFFNRHPVRWLPVASEVSSQSIVVDGKFVG